MPPLESICPSIRQLFGVRSTNLPSALTLPSIPPLARMSPSMIVSVGGGPKMGAQLLDSAYENASLDRPVYTPSNAVVVGAGAWAATGVINMQAAIARSVLGGPNMLLSLVPGRG